MSLLVKTPLTAFQKFIAFTGAFIVLLLTLWMLKTGAAILIPLALAVVVWYILSTLSTLYRHVPFTEKLLPEWLTIIFAFATFGYAIWLFESIVIANMQQLIETLPEYQTKIHVLIGNVGNRFGISESSLAILIPDFDFETFIKRIANEIGSLAKSSGTVLVYVIFLLIEQHVFYRKLEIIFKSRRQLRNVEKILSRINTDIQTYILIQTIVSLVTGILVFLVLQFFGVEFAAFWGLMTFVLHYIPVIGPIVATILPVMFAFVQFDQFLPVFVLGMIIVTIHFTIGNIVLPRFWGSSLNLSPLTILVSLAVWESIWGTAGMFLSVPIMAIINIILSGFDSTRWIAVLLSGTGKVR